MKPSRNGSKTTVATSKDSHKIFFMFQQYAEKLNREGA
jgi:hypothetical protein